MTHVFRLAETGQIPSPKEFQIGFGDIRHDFAFKPPAHLFPCHWQTVPAGVTDPETVAEPGIARDDNGAFRLAPSFGALELNSFGHDHASAALASTKEPISTPSRSVSDDPFRAGTSISDSIRCHASKDSFERSSGPSFEKSYTPSPLR